MKALAAAGIVLLASCQEPTPAPPVGVTPPAKVKAAAPASAVTAGKVTSMDLTLLFPRQQADTVLLYDARPGFVAGFGKIPGAISWPRHDFEARLSQREPEIRAAKQAGKPVVFYCTDAACPDAGMMAERLAAKGYDVAILEGGFAAWKEAGLPTE